MASPISAGIASQILGHPRNDGGILGDRVDQLAQEFGDRRRPRLAARGGEDLGEHFRLDMQTPDRRVRIAMTTSWRADSRSVDVMVSEIWAR